jgi:hypothetical protein
MVAIMATAVVVAVMVTVLVVLVLIVVTAPAKERPGVATTRFAGKGRG